MRKNSPDLSFRRMVAQGKVFVFIIAYAKCAIGVATCRPDCHIRNTRSVGLSIEPSVDLSGARIRIGRNVQVSLHRPTWMHTETYVATDPRDYRKLVACSIMGSSQGGLLEERDVVYSSDDQGQTWTPRLSIGRASDPMCAYTVQGTAMFIATRIGPRSVSSVYRSPDGGYLWSFAGDILPLDHPSVATGITEGKESTWIGGQSLLGESGARESCTGNFPVVAVRSDDDGKSFSIPVTVVADARGYCLTAVGSAVSFSGGAPVYIVLKIRQPPLDSPNLPDNPNSSLGIVRIAAAGIAVSEIPHVYSEPTALWTTVKAALAVDESRGIFGGRMYAAWSDWRTGRCEVLLSYSDDRGRTWAIPRVINDDHRFSGGRPGPDDTQVMLAVNRSGVVGVAWYSRADSGDDLGWTVRFRASLDGGMSWLPSAQVSSVANDLNVPRNWSGEFQVQTGGGVIRILAGYHAYQFFTGGDYSGMAVDAEGVFHPVWSDDRTGVSQIWTAQVRVPSSVHRSASATLASYVVPAPVQVPPVPEVLEYHALPFGAEEPNTLPRVSGVSDVRYDSKLGTFSFSIRLKNVSAKAIHGPWRLYVEEVLSSYGGVRVLHTDNGETQAGAVWMFRASNGDILNPGASSAPRRVVIRLRHETPFRVSEFWGPATSPPTLALIDYRIEAGSGGVSMQQP